MLNRRGSKLHEEGNEMLAPPYGSKCRAGILQRAGTIGDGGGKQAFEGDAFICESGPPRCWEGEDGC